MTFVTTRLTNDYDRSVLCDQRMPQVLLAYELQRRQCVPVMSVARQPAALLDLDHGRQA